MNIKYTSHNRAGESPEIPNVYFENLLRLRSQTPTAFRLLSPALRLATGYEAAKGEAARSETANQMDNGTPSPDESTKGVRQ